ncbi:MAG: nitrous oxide reductase accessory protein NosL [Phycisphaerales bacterium]|nr:nitrous oxide reductase accessory protein NosL [Phycisphaerales bacterium]
MRRSTTVSAALASLLLTAPSCRREVPIEPPSMRYGESICVECGMAISDERYAAAMLVRAPGDEIEALRFDDIGCMVDHELDNDALDVLRRYVHDHDTRAWLDAEQAVYLRAASLRTPMASGLAAFRDRAAADAAAAQWPGETLDFATIAGTIAVPPPDFPRRAPAH